MTTTPARSPATRRFALGGLVALVLTVPASTPAFAGRACQQQAGSRAHQELPTLAVIVAADDASYRRGQTAVVSVQVRQGAPVGPKVAAAQVRVVISSGSKVVKELYGQTDARGSARLPWKIGATIPVGKATATATASVLTLDSFDCTGGVLYETGQGAADPLTTIRPS